MTLFLKSLSRRVHEEHHELESHDGGLLWSALPLRLVNSVGRTPVGQKKEHHEQDYKTNGACTSLTVWRKSLIFGSNGFTVIDSNGNLVYRVDNYTKRLNEVILMDGSGKPILTMCRYKQKLRLVDNWLVYEGEVGDYSTTKSLKKPICCAKKHINILQPNGNVLAHVYRGTSDKQYAYVIEGSFAHRSCKVLDESRRIVAEIRKKEAMIGGVSFGLEVFLLIIQPGVDPRFAMAIVLLLDQMFS